jgi:hypothetical protein
METTKEKVQICGRILEMKSRQLWLKYRTIVQGLFLGTEVQKLTLCLMSLKEKKPDLHIAIVDGTLYINQTRTQGKCC